MTLRPLLLVLLVLAAPVAAQSPGAVSSADARIQEGLQAYAAGDFAQAERLLRAVVAESPRNAEARYALGRVLADDRNPNEQDAAGRREIGRAADLEPDNVVYLVGELEALRRDANNFFVELLLAEKRKDVARRLLAVDPDNAFAHEELGIAAIRDYYVYRNAVRLPELSGDSFSGDDRTDEVNGPEGVPQGVVEQRPGDVPEGGLANTNPTADVAPLQRDPLAGDPGALGQIYARNRFDVAAMQEQGVSVVTYRNRADQALARAQDHLGRALAADPRRRDVYDHVVRLSVISGDFESAVGPMEQMYTFFPEDADMWLYLGLVNHRLGNWEGADVAFREGIRRLDPDGRAAFTDLTLILPPSDWDAYRADPDVYAERYWNSRDPRFLNTVNERRTEHYARLVHSDLMYASDDLGLPGWKTERGEIFVRYGIPESDVVIEGSYGLVVQSFPGRLATFEPSPTAVSANRFNVWDYGDLFFVFEDPFRNGEFRLYSPPADLFGLQSGGLLQEMDFVIRTRETIRDTPERYTFETPGRPIRLPYRVAAFKGASGADLYLGYGIPVADVDGDVGLTVQTAAALVGPDRNVLAERRRTLYGLRRSQIVDFDDTRLWTGVERLTAGPGPHEVQLEFEAAAGTVSASQRQRIDVPDFSTDRLQLSDLLMAYAVDEADDPVPGRVFRDGLAIQPAPWGVYAVDDAIHVYFEVYNLALDGGRSDFEVEARLIPKDTSSGLGRLAKRLFGSRERGVSTAAEAQGNSTDDSQALILDASGQEPGLYMLTVVVRDRTSGATTERETDLMLEE